MRLEAWNFPLETTLIGLGSGARPRWRMRRDEEPAAEARGSRRTSGAGREKTTRAGAERR